MATTIGYIPVVEPVASSVEETVAVPLEETATEETATEETAKAVKAAKGKKSE